VEIGELPAIMWHGLIEECCVIADKVPVNVCACVHEYEGLTRG